MSTIEVGDLLYEYTVKFTEVTEYGVNLEALLAGEAAPPVEGARFDVAFEGESTGPRLKGNVKGVELPANSRGRPVPAPHTCGDHH